MNVSMMHGVRASLALQKTGDLHQALARETRKLRLIFLSWTRAGTAIRLSAASADEMEVEFVCIPRPVWNAPTARTAARWHIVLRIE